MPSMVQTVALIRVWVAAAVFGVARPKIVVTNTDAVRWPVLSV